MKKNIIILLFGLLFSQASNPSITTKVVEENILTDDVISFRSQALGGIILDDLDFEIELIARDKINVSYIIALLTNMKNKSPEEQAKSRKTIVDILDTGSEQSQIDDHQ